MVKDDWATLEVGDLISFVSPDDREVICRVLGLPRFAALVEAFSVLGAELVPVPGADAAAVERLYGQYYSAEQQAQYGVVAIHVTPI